MARGAGFEVYSQAGDESARSALLWFEQLRAFSQQLTGPVLDSRPPVRVIAFRSVSEYNAYRLRPTSDAYSVSTENQDYIVMPAFDTNGVRLAAHEYAHLILHAAGVKLPPWLSEGMAEFFSTVRISERGSSLGGDLPSHSQSLQRESWIPISDLVAIPPGFSFPSRANAGLFYAESWALAQMLIISPEYNPRFPALIRALSSGRPSSQTLSSIYEKSIDTIAQDLHAWVRARKFPTITLPGVRRPTAVAMDIQPISQSASQSLIADLLLATGYLDRAEAIYRDLADNSAHDPNVSAALGTIALRKGNPQRAREEWKRAIEDGVGNADLCYRYAVLAQDAGLNAEEIRPALEKAIVLRPDFDDARYNLALLESNHGRFEAAVAQLRAMRKIAPARAYGYWSAMAYALNELGRREDAKAAAEKAMKHATSPGERANAAQLAYISQTDLTVQFTRDAKGMPQLITTRVAHNTPNWNPFIEPGDNIRRVDAKLQEFDCSGDKATQVTVDTQDGHLTLAIPDPLHVQMRNAPAEFTCGPQSDRAVIVEYAISKTQGTNVDGVLRGMEFR